MLEKISKTVHTLVACITILGVFNFNAKISEVNAYQLIEEFEYALETTISHGVQQTPLYFPNALEFAIEPPLKIFNKVENIEDIIDGKFTYDDGELYYKVFDQFYGLGDISFIKTLSRDFHLRSIFCKEYKYVDVKFKDISIEDNTITIDNSTINLGKYLYSTECKMPIIKLEVKRSLTNWKRFNIVNATSINPS